MNKPLNNIFIKSNFFVFMEKTAFNRFNIIKSLCCVILF